MRPWPGSLRWQTLIVVVAALGLSQAAAMWLLNEYVTRPRTETAIGQFVFHLKTLSAAMQTLEPAQQRQFIQRVAEQEGIRIMPVRGDEPMQPAPDRPQLRVFRERLKEHFGPGTEVYVRDGRGPKGKGRDGEARGRLLVRLPAGEREFWVAIPRTRVERETATAFLWWSVAGLAIAVLVTAFLMWRLTRPLESLAGAAAALGRGRDPEPVAETGPREIRDVARAFNQMTRDLKRNERERATFLAGISHDLRTPLTRLRLDVEMLEGKVDPAVMRGMISDVEDMNAIIDQFIDFTRSESAEPIGPVDLAQVARASAERAARSGAVVHCELDPVPVLAARPLAIRRLVDNLLGNAAKHAGGEIRLVTQAEKDRVVLAVLDRGPGIDPAMVERLKEPFTRLDASRAGSSGAGLGLAIAERIARLHGAALELLPRSGGGLEARVTFPVPNA